MVLMKLSEIIYKSKLHHKTLCHKRAKTKWPQFFKGIEDKDFRILKTSCKNNRTHKESTIIIEVNKRIK
jgi:hypothetical protein